MYDKNTGKYYLGDSSYEIDNGRKKDERIFQINMIKSLSTDVIQEEFYSQEDEYSFPSKMNNYFKNQLEYYLDTYDDDDYERNKYLIQNDIMKIIKNGNTYDLITKINDDKYNFDYKKTEYVITFYNIKPSINPIVKYFKIALNMMIRYLKYIEDYNNNLSPDSSILMEGSSREYDMIKECKIYKIPLNIHEYVASDWETHNIEMGEPTIYDESKINKIVSNVEYNYLVENNKNLSKITFSPQITIGINPLQLINVATKIENYPDNTLFLTGLSIIEEKFVSDDFELSYFDKNILSYVFYCSMMIYYSFQYAPILLFKYMIGILIRHKISNFKIFKNINFINLVKEIYIRQLEFDDIKCFCYLILLIAKDSYYTEIDDISFEMDKNENGDNSNLETSLNLFKENVELLTIFLNNNSSHEYNQKIKNIYSSWNDLTIKQYPYVETKTYDNPLLFEIRIFGIDLNTFERNVQKNASLSLDKMMEIMSKVDDEITSSFPKSEQLSKKTKKIKIKK